MGPVTSLATISASQVTVQDNNVMIVVSVSISILFAAALVMISARLRAKRSRKNADVVSKLTSVAMKTTAVSVDQSRTMSSTRSVAIALPGYLKFDDVSKILEIESLLGKGGTASVFKGRLVDQALIKTHGVIDVAVKRMDIAGDLTDFNYEVIIMSSLPKDCPYVAKLIGYQDSPPLIVMKFYAFSLMEYLDGLKTKIPYGTVLSISSDIARGMQAIHSKAIIHFDLKPMNVMLDVGASFQSFTCVICDFGFANFLDDGRKQLVAGMRAPTTTGITARYAAPELFKTGSSADLSHHRRNAKIDLMIDVFAFSMTLYAIACQHKPWYETDDYDVIEEVIMKGLRPAVPEDLNETIAAIIRRCWAQEPELRMTFDEIVDVLLQEISDFSSNMSSVIRNTDTNNVIQIAADDHTTTSVDLSATGYSATRDLINKKN